MARSHKKMCFLGWLSSDSYIFGGFSPNFMWHDDVLFCRLPHGDCLVALKMTYFGVKISDIFRKTFS